MSKSGKTPSSATGRKFVTPRSSRLPGFWALFSRSIIVVLSNIAALWVLSRLVPGFRFDSGWALLLAGIVIGLLNSVVWPALTSIVTPISVLTLGIGAIVINALGTWAALNWLPGIHLRSVETGLILSLGISLVTALFGGFFAVNDDAWYDEQMALRVRRHQDRAVETDIPGVVFIQLDGLSRNVLEQALGGGDVPTLYRWLTDGHHRLVSWETEWSSQTGVSQCGILHGSVDDMPAFRWYEKDKHRMMVSNHPTSAAEIERRHSDGNGLLAYDGSSYGNLFSGDAERAVMTMSNGGKVREGKIGSGYFGYFARPSQAVRTMYATFGELVIEWTAATNQIRRGVQPRVHRGFLYAFLRAFTVVISRDVSVAGILRDMAEGRSAIYVDFLGYDEVAHHSGPERADTLAVLRKLDQQIERIERATRFCPRPYRIVVLSDHGQTQGECFADKYGMTVMDLVGKLADTATTTDQASVEGKTESSAWFRPKATSDKSDLDGKPKVLASGNLSLVYLPGPQRRLTRDEIDQAYPGLIDGLVKHEGIGFVLVATSDDESVALGAGGEHWFPSGKVVGDDPLAPFGEHAAAKVARADNYTNIGDLMLNSSYFPDRDEVTAFELQVGSHGGLGGNQTHPFVLAPNDMVTPELMIGPVAVHLAFKQYLKDLGQPVTVTKRPKIDGEPTDSKDASDTGAGNTTAKTGTS